MKIMALIALSEAEKNFIIQGVDQNLRLDGRKHSDYRPMELETGVVSNASGSARLRLANTDILIGIKTEIFKPHFSTPNKGKIEFFVDCSANATPQFEGRGGERLAVEIADTLNRIYETNDCFDLTDLCILENQQCWKLYVDILILECGGNLYDAVSLATKAALYNTRLPEVTAQILDAGETDLIISDDPFNCKSLKISNVPILVTVCKIGDSLVVDPSAEEEECGLGCAVLAVSPTTTNECFAGLTTVGSTSFHFDTLVKGIELAHKVGQQVNGLLMNALTREEKLNKKEYHTVGFLK